MKRFLIRKWKNLLISKGLLFGILIFLTFLYLPYANAQERISLKNINGSCTVQNISPEKAKEEAILEAKKNALRQAGIVENINAIDALNSYSEQSKMVQFFNSFSTIQLNGAIVDWSIVKEEKKVDEFNNFVFNVSINATVIKYSSTIDNEFVLLINGIKDVYKEDEEISFTIKPTKPCYIKFFLIESPDSVVLVFPNEYEPDRVFTPLIEYHFPLNDQIKYTADVNKSSESNIVLIIATKRNVPYTYKLDYNNLMNWLNGIEPYEKNVTHKVINFFSKK